MKDLEPPFEVKNIGNMAYIHKNRDFTRDDFVILNKNNSVQYISDDPWLFTSTEELNTASITLEFKWRDFYLKEISNFKGYHSEAHNWFHRAMLLSTHNEVENDNGSLVDRSKDLDENAFIVKYSLPKNGKENFQEMFEIVKSKKEEYLFNKAIERMNFIVSTVNEKFAMNLAMQCHNLISREEHIQQYLLENPSINNEMQDIKQRLREIQEMLKKVELDLINKRTEYFISFWEKSEDLDSETKNILVKGLKQGLLRPRSLRLPL